MKKLFCLVLVVIILATASLPAFAANCPTCGSSHYMGPFCSDTYYSYTNTFHKTGCWYDACRYFTLYVCNQHGPFNSGNHACWELAHDCGLGDVSLCPY